MSLYDYQESLDISSSDPAFYALIMAAMRKADSTNIEKLKAAWPEVYTEYHARYNAPFGIIPELDRITPEEHMERMRAAEEEEARINELEM